MKTGSTSLALYNLSASATRDDLSLIAVIMKAPSTKIRFAEAQSLLDYGFNNFSYKEFGKAYDVVGNVNVDKGLNKQVEAVLSSNSGTLLKKGQENNIKQVVNLPNSISAPVTQGQKIGEVNFLLDDEIISSVDIIAKNSVDKINLFNISKNIYYSWVQLLR